VDAYSLVPKDFVENLRFRVRLRRRCEQDAGLRKAMMDACREDVLFFMNAWGFLHEPRPRRDAAGRRLPEIIPFITWPHQDPVILAIRERLGFGDVGCEKSRGEGMTWIAVYLALQDWIFAIPGTRMVSIGLVSRTMEFADTPSDINSLLPKFDWALEQMPEWMVGRKDVDYVRLVKDHTLRNKRNNCLISAYASTGEVGSGGRYTYWIVDELSKFPSGNDHDALTSTQATTDSRLIIGTPYGDVGAYHNIMHKVSSMKKLVLRWEDNPVRNRGMYRMVDHVPVAVDPASNPLPDNYSPPTQKILDLFGRLRANGFRLEKRVRSPWYDHECDRANANPFNIAQELDRDYGGSLFRIFTADFFTAARATVRPPFCRVNVNYDDELQPVVTKSSDGHLALWMTLDTRNQPPDHPCIVSADISTGLGGTHTSNSVLEILDALTMEQVGELVTNTTPPDDLADLAVAICYWLGDACLAWERNGPGAAFTARVKEIGYPVVYLRTKLFDKRRRKKTKEPGWWTDQRSKEVLFSELKRIVVIEELKVHSSAFVDECGQYIRIGRAIEHVANARAKAGAADGPDTGENHGDRVIAMGVGVQALRDRPLSRPGRAAAEAVEPNSIEERDREYAAKLREMGDDWDARTNWDLMGGHGAADRGW